MHNQLVPVPARRHPMQVLVAVMLLLSGLSILTGGPRPGSINTALPTPLLLLWAGVLTAGGALVVLAAVVPPLLALFFELVADLPLAVMCLVYAASAFMLAGWRAVVLVALVTAVASAFTVRAVQVMRTLRAVRRHISRE
jgi:type II secretory pathway component PulF